MFLAYDIPTAFCLNFDCLLSKCSFCSIWIHLINGNGDPAHLLAVFRSFWSASAALQFTSPWGFLLISPPIFLLRLKDHFFCLNLIIPPLTVLSFLFKIDFFFFLYYIWSLHCFLQNISVLLAMFDFFIYFL